MATKPNRSRAATAPTNYSFSTYRGIIEKMLRIHKGAPTINNLLLLEACHMKLKLTAVPKGRKLKTRGRPAVPSALDRPKVISLREKRWEQNLEKVKNFKTGQGYFPTELDNPKLNDWILNQRRLHRTGRLSLYRRRRLEEVSDWTWDPHEDDWQEHYRMVRNFVRQNHRMPTREDSSILGEWIITQRKFAKERQLAPRRRSKLLLLDKNFFDHD